MYIDSHAHLSDERFDEDRAEIIGSFKNQELEFIIEVGSDYKNSLCAFDLAQRHNNVYCALGIHPHDAKSARECDIEHFARLSSNSKVVAIGEIGLDYYYDLSPREEQKKVFIRQMQLAHDIQLPVILHLRDAYEDMYNILSEHKELFKYGALLHCYSGSEQMLQRFLDLGLYIALGGAITFKNAKKDDVIKAVPIDRLMLETDSPYLTPHPHRGERNQPAYVQYVYSKVAEARGIENTELQTAVRSNVLRFFSKIDIKP